MGFARPIAPIIALLGAAIVWVVATRDAGITPGAAGTAVSVTTEETAAAACWTAGTGAVAVFTAENYY